MKFNAIITDVLPAKTGITERGDYCFVPIEIEIPEPCRRTDGTTFVREHHLKVDVGGSYAKNFSLEKGTNIIIDIFFDVKEKDGRKFQTLNSNFIMLR